MKIKKLLRVSEEIFKGKFASSKKIVLEEYLDGEEASYFIVADKNSFKFFGTAQDHKELVKMIQVLILEEWELIHQRQ